MLKSCKWSESTRLKNFNIFKMYSLYINNVFTPLDFQIKAYKDS